VSGVDLLRFAWGALKGHRLRTALTLLGMAIGVGAVILLTALGEGARGYVTNEFMALGSNLLIVLPGKTETTGNAPILGGTIRPLTLEDCEAIERRVPRVRRLAPLSVGSARIGYGERRREVTVLGSTPDLLPVRHLSVGIGRFLPDVEAGRGASVAVIGRTVQGELFGDANPLGQPIRIGDWRFRVVGVMAAKGQSLGINMDDVVIIPVSSALRLFNQPSLFRILIEVGAHSEIDAARTEVMRILRERHENEEDVTVLTQDSVLGAFNRILGALTLAVAGIAAISLSVAGIGIMNVMLVSVSERTPEVGLLKALGATPRQILRVFLVEAILLSAAGGLLGLLVGYLGSAALGQVFPALPTRPPTWAVLAALAVSLMAGGLFGVLPARRAARLDPVVALAGR
jgi:putative ABC transport system permease protein